MATLQISRLQRRPKFSFAPAANMTLTGRSTRPLWFDGRFLGARDLERDQDDFLRRQADFGRAAGFGVVHGLMVRRVAPTGQPADAESIVIAAGHGLTPGGQLVTIAQDLTVRLSDLAEQQSLGTQFGIAAIPAPSSTASIMASQPMHELIIMWYRRRSLQSRS